MAESTLLPYVFFDAAGTLFHLRESVGAGYARISADFGFSLDPATTDSAFGRAFAKADLPTYSDSDPGADADEAEVAWWKTFVSGVFADAGENPDRPEFVPCFDALFSFYGKAEAWRLFPETKSALEVMASSNLPFGVLSNFDSRLRHILNEFGIAGLFDHIVISSEIRASKPHAKAFSAAAGIVDRTPNECILVGDDPHRDQHGALSAGFQSVELVKRPDSDLLSIAKSLVSRHSTTQI